MSSDVIRLAIVGVGNCASSLVQGIAYYRARQPQLVDGLMHPTIGPFSAGDIDVVAAFDVDERKVGRPLSEAVFAPPNCTTVFEPELSGLDVPVKMGPPLDGIAGHMSSYPADRAFRAAQHAPVDVARELADRGAEVLVCYLPVGSRAAATHYAQACLDAGVALVNCIPVFIASNPRFAEEFTERGVPLVGDDIKSQFGATMLHRVLARTLTDRGVRVRRTYQLNTGGNTDFLNMLDRARLGAKRLSKTESVQSQLDVALNSSDIHIGPSDYVSWQKDNKVCFLRVEWEGFGGVPMNVEVRLSVEDSPNSAGVAIDAIRCARLARDAGVGGPLEAVSAYTMKRPPRQMRDTSARLALDAFIDRLVATTTIAAALSPQATSERDGQSAPRYLRAVPPLGGES